MTVDAVAKMPRRRSDLTRFLSDRSFMVGVLLFVPLLLLTVLAPIVSPYDPLAINVMSKFRPPSAEHLLGTDEFGRDLLARVLYGARTSLMVGAVTATLTCIFGLFLGALAGFSRVADAILMRIMDGLMAFPGILLAIIVVASLGPGTGGVNVIIAMVIIYTPRLTRVVRSTVLEVKQQEFVDAARLIGLSNPGILIVHVLPNCLTPVIVQTTFGFAWAILVEAGLSFVGLGPPPPAPTWGNIISAGREFFRIAPWLVVAPGVAISIAVLSLNLIGDGLRNILDPRLRNVA
jgi:peptide/nickel transport system permease protein